MDRGRNKHAHARSHLRRRLAQQRDGRNVELVERSPEREARSGTVSKTFQGIQRVAYYVGSFPVPDKGSGGHEFVAEKLKKMIVNAKSLAGKPIKLFILPTGVKVYQVDGETLFMAHALPRIVFTVPEEERRLFAFVAINPPNKGGEAFCHCFHCNQTEYVTELSALVNKAFKLAYAARMSNEKKFDKHRPPAPSPAPGETATSSQPLPSRPPRKGADLKHSQSNIEGQRPVVQVRRGGSPPSLSADHGHGDPKEEPSLQEQYMEVQAEKERLLEKKKAIAKRRDQQVHLGTGQAGPSQAVPRGTSKGPPPMLPDRHVNNPPVTAPTHSPQTAAAKSGTLPVPKSAAAASRAALANRSSFHGVGSAGGMMKRRIVKGKSDSALSKPDLPPREGESPPVTARGPPPISRGARQRPASIAAMPSAAMPSAASPGPPRPLPKSRQPPSPELPPVVRSHSQPATQVPEVDDDYDLVEASDPRAPPPAQQPPVDEPTADHDYDMVAFDGPPKPKPRPPDSEPPPLQQAIEVPKPKPRKSIRRGKPQSASSSIRVSYSDDPNVYEDVPEEQEEEEKAPEPLPKFVEERRPVPGFDGRVRSNSFDYGPVDDLPMSVSAPPRTSSALQETVDDEYEFMADQAPPKSRHMSSCSMGSLPEDSEAADEEADIDDQLRELQLEEQALQEAEWFQATIPREMAMDILRKQPTGGFIVRNSRSSPGSFSLTVKSPAGKLVSFLVRRHPEKNLYTLSDTGSNVFNDLPSLIDFYSKNKSVLPCLLSLVVANPTQASSAVVDDEDYERCEFTNMEPWPGKK